jgi:hypothetical protein
LPFDAFAAIIIRADLRNVSEADRHWQERSSLMNGAATESPLLPFNPRLARSGRFAPEMFILEQSVQKNHPILAQLVTWRNSVSLFREQERQDFRNLRGDPDHRSVLSMLIAQGEVLLHHSKLQQLKLEDVGLSVGMIESEVGALRDDMRITHEELMSDQEADEVLSAFSHA